MWLLPLGGNDPPDLGRLPSSQFLECDSTHLTSQCPPTATVLEFLFALSLPPFHLANTELWFAQVCGLFATATSPPSAPMFCLH